MPDGDFVNIAEQLNVAKWNNSLCREQSQWGQWHITLIVSSLTGLDSVSYYIKIISCYRDQSGQTGDQSLSDDHSSYKVSECSLWKIL